ncbi:hypothetical protein LFYK43_11140 [Ligilactobacillus salitolerans]|uniref:Uncharacterized protein n=1 Tax=Ligilactobacillus salitolerans TaxID=1808352 RepID=A0A401IT31_9LACO|nr:hypothetical protein [Ligilactobacillus salitolerans]GBG94655.1 hypothetical protein LFYK43_11140 [Ligilactobacillus salitolerans]
MDGSTVALIVGFFGLVGTLYTVKGTFRNTNVDIIDKLMQANDKIEKLQKENLELMEQIKKLQDTVNDLMEELGE